MGALLMKWPRRLTSHYHMKRFTRSLHSAHLASDGQSKIADVLPRRQFFGALGSVASCVALPSLGLLAPKAAYAGGQLEEPLVDSVRSALTAAVSRATPPEPVFADTAARMFYLRWLTTNSAKLERRMPSTLVRHEFLQSVWYESKRAGLDTAMVLGLIQVESAFRKHAVSPVGARGYMQIMPFWTRVIGDGDSDKLFHMQTNLRFGNVILRHYLDLEKGDLFMALGRYNGSRGRATYPDAVFAAQRNWEFVDPGAPPQESVVASASENGGTASTN